MFYYDTRKMTPRLILDLSTFCIASAFFLLEMIVLLNIFITFAVCYYNTICNIKKLRNNETINFQSV